MPILWNTNECVGLPTSTQKYKTISGVSGMLAQMEIIRIACNSLVTREKLIEEKCLIIEFAAYIYIYINVYL